MKIIGSRQLVGRLTLFAALASFFALSQAFRTLPSIILPALADEFDASPAALAKIGMIFHISFALLQLPCGIALDRFALRSVFTLALTIVVLGALVSAYAGSIEELYAGQLLLGAGCAPALVGAMVQIARTEPPQSFPFLIGMVMSVGSVGILATSAPFAWLVSVCSWSATFFVLGSATVVVLILSTAILPACNANQRPNALSQAKGSRRLLREPALWGLLTVAFVSYSSVLTIRALWIVPLFRDRYELSLNATGGIAFVFSLAIAFSPMFMGWIARRGANLNVAVLTAGIAIAASSALLGAQLPLGMAADIALVLLLGLMSAINIQIYSIAKSTTIRSGEGRLLSLVNLATFAGIAFAQWGSGVVGDAALSAGMNYANVICLAIASFCLIGVSIFAFLPKLRNETNGPKN
ncbi:MFS transporter [Arvimicrobium flavum]|uniref:MFS transporter n=1 Tax=Arvimicrobium flavum TaxID=3393320 RepID=UPI00237BAC86|nr:MFS transporter [Mesorhizobium shangrilense]